MKNPLFIFILALALVLGPGFVRAQSNAPAASLLTFTPPTETPASPAAAPSLSLSTSSILDLLTNIPTASSYTNASIEVSLGAVMDGTGASFKNSIEVQKNFGQTFLLAGEIQNGTGSSVIESAALYVGFRKAGLSWEIYGMGGLRRDWSNSKWDALLVGGVAYGPCYAEDAFIISSFKDQPSNELRAGVRLKF